MTRQKLKQFRHLKSEIRLIQEQIAAVEAEIITDKVTGSDPDHPWTERSFIIRACPVSGTRSSCGCGTGWSGGKAICRICAAEYSSGWRV